MKKLLHLALPIGLQGLMLAAVGAADAIMLGSLEQNAMTAVSLATQIQFMQNYIIASACGALIILGAQYWGKKDRGTVDTLFGMTLKICMAVSVLVFAGCVFTPRYLMLLFTDEEVLIGIGVRYLRIAGWSYLMTGVSQSYLTLLKISDKARDTAVISGVTVVGNMVLNALFIFGLLGFPALGAEGAAVATLIARGAELIWSVALSFRKGYLRPSLGGLLRHDAALAKSYNKCFLPVLGSYLVWGIGFTSYSSFMGHLGTDAAGAASVAAVVRELVCCLCTGLAAGGGIIIGNELGAGDLEKGKLYGDRTMKIAFLCGLTSTALVAVSTPVLMLCVNLTEEAGRYLIGMMLILAVYMIGRSVNTIVINGIFSAGGDTMFDVYSLAVTMWGLAIPLAALGTFVFRWNPLIVYGCTCLDEVGKIPWVMYHYRKYKWVKDLTKHEA